MVVKVIQREGKTRGRRRRSQFSGDTHIMDLIYEGALAVIKKHASVQSIANGDHHENTSRNPREHQAVDGGTAPHAVKRSPHTERRKDRGNK